jgi:hypothetical protein
LSPEAGMSNNSLIPVDQITHKILWIRKSKVMLDADLAALYGVQTKVLLQAVKRNKDRFPEDFMFQLTKAEYVILRSQIVTSKRGGRQYPPYVFTEQGVAMLSSVLRSQRAIQVNILIMRAFVILREMISSHKELANKLEQMEKKYDYQFRIIFEAIKELKSAPPKSSKKIGF